MEENKNTDSSFSDGLSISDHELEKSYTHSKVNKGFKQLKAYIEGLNDIIDPKNFNSYDLADPSTADASIADFTRKLPKPTPRANQMDILEGESEGKESTSEMNELLMQWIRKLIEEKKEADKAIDELMKNRNTKVNKEQNLKRNHDKLKERNKLLEKKIVELQQSLQESEIQKKSIENTLRLTLESGFNKMGLVTELGRKVEESEVVSQLKKELKQKDKELERMNKETEELTHIVANYKVEIDMLKKTHRLALVAFKEKLENGITKLGGEVGKKSEEFDERIRSLSELTARPEVVKLWIVRNGKEGLIKYIIKLKDYIEDLRRIQKEMQAIKKFTWELKPLYRVF